MKWGDALNSTHIYFTIQGMKRRSMVPSHYLNLFLFAPSCKRGRWEGAPLAAWKGKGTRASGSRCLFGGFPMKNRQDCNTAGVMQTGPSTFQGSLFSRPVRKRRYASRKRTVSVKPDHSFRGAQLLINQDSNGWLIFQEVHEMTETKLPTALYFSNHLHLRKLEFLYPRSPPLKQWGHLLGSNSGT